MSDRKKIVLPELRFKGSEESDLNIKLSVEQHSRTIVEGDRTVILNQSEQYDRERQSSDKYRLTGVIRPIWGNVTDVVTTDPLIGQEMYLNQEYIDQLIKTNSTTPDTFNIEDVRGKISSDEIDFIRKDYNGSNDPNNYTFYNNGNGFGPVNANKINWNLLLTYPFGKETSDDTLTIDTKDGSPQVTFKVSDGLPYVVEDMGSYYEFYSPFPHGLATDNFVLIQGELFSVAWVGNEKYRSDENYFSIYKAGFNFTPSQTGTMKRVLDRNNIEESTSEYYILKHKVIRVHSDFTLQKNAFESTLFKDIKKIPKYGVNADSSLKYNDDGKIVSKEIGDTYMYILEDEIDVKGLKDHLNREITELYVTTIHKNGMTFFDRQEFCYKEQLGLGNEAQNLSVEELLYTNPNDITVKDFQVGDELLGGIYEYNKGDLEERLVSDRKLRLVYNSTHFTDIYGPSYFYDMHHKYQLKVMSDYIEESDTDDIYNFPPYATYYQKDNVWRWRDVWPKGYVDPNGRGVDYPFINGTHYLNKVITFKIQPDTIDGLTNNRVKDYRINRFTDIDCE